MRHNERLALQGFIKENTLNNDLRRRTIQDVAEKFHLPGSSTKRVLEERYVRC